MIGLILLMIALIVAITLIGAADRRQALRVPARVSRPQVRRRR